eukprot:6893808-Lingulodinium_polyedra.AAC.1
MVRPRRRPRAGRFGWRGSARGLAPCITCSGPRGQRRRAARLRARRFPAHPAQGVGVAGVSARARFSPRFWWRR